MRLAPTALRLALAASLALAAFGADAAAPGRRSASASGPLVIRIGQAEGLTHLDFPKEGPARFERKGEDIVLSFPRASVSPDTARLVNDPVRLIDKAAAEVEGAGLTLVLTPSKGVEVKLERVDGSPTLILKAPPIKTRDQPPGRRQDPTPASGRVPVAFSAEGSVQTLTFSWRGPLGTAVFRRGEGLWIVFDARAALDLSSLQRSKTAPPAAVVQGPAFTALRLTTGKGPVALSGEGGTYTLALGRGAASDAVKISRDESAPQTSLRVEMAGSTGVFWIRDPVVGDQIAVVTALLPSKGAPTPRALVDVRVLASVQGLALAPLVDDLLVSADPDLVHITRPGGLDLSGGVRAAGGAGSNALALQGPRAASFPALVDAKAWSDTGGTSFTARLDELERRAAQEAAKGKAGGVSDRLALARFLVGSDLAFEGLGVLGLAAKADPTLIAKPEFRGLRGAARAMAGRFKEAEADFSAPALAGDPASSLWRSYIEEKLGDHQGAHQAFLLGRPAFALFPPKWRARFAEADAFAALELKAPDVVAGDLGLVRGLALEPTEADPLKLISGRLAEARGQTDEALHDYDLAGASTWGAVAAPATLRAVNLRLATGKLQPRDAEPLLSSLKYRWRGDATELEIARALGKLYLNEGRYREALQSLNSANGRLPDNPASLAISQDLSGIFRTLFLDGGADGLQPIQALALFYDFKDLTPIGADGDAMVRKLARRLVDVDLLDQAAELLKYQADNRLDGVPRAEVDTDLAMIELMNKQPELALDALNASRTTLLPKDLNARRRVIEARAHVELGRYDAALELLQGQKGQEADALRTEIAWRRRSWPEAAALLEAQLGDRWKDPRPLTPAEQSVLVRAGAAFSLAGDDAGLGRLRRRYEHLAEAAPAPNIVKIALDGIDPGRVTAEDFRRLVDDASTFEGWVTVMKRRFSSENTPISGGRPDSGAKASGGKA